MHSVTLVINGESKFVEVEGTLTLLRYLRDQLGLVGAKNGCAKGHCGTCTVIINGEAKRSCLVRMGKLTDGTIIETIEGLTRQDGGLHPIQQAYISEGAVQCGFCTPGMIMATKALLDKSIDPSDEQIKDALKFNLCRCTGYTTIIKAVKKAASLVALEMAETEGLYHASLYADVFNNTSLEEKKSFGVSVIRKDVTDKAKGKGVFADDYYMDGMLYGRLVFSEHSHAEILSIDTEQAMNMEGVQLVVTAKDIPGLNRFGLIVPQQPVLADTKVRYLGDVVAAVFAEQEDQLEKAVKAIDVEYRPLPAIFSAVDAFYALESDRVPKVHEQGNLVDHVKVRKGDIDVAFASADVIVEGEYYTPAIEHAYMEPEACIVKPLEDGSIEIYTGNQGSIAFQSMIAKSLDMPLEKVRVIYTPCGGAFGGKEEPTVQIHAALAAIKTGRPVKMTMTREESIRMSTKRHAVHVYMKHGATKDGKLVAFESRAICNAGAYMSLTKPVVFRAAVVASGPYQIPNVKADSYGIYTNTNPAGAFRGFGSTQVTFAAEIQMDKLAEKLGISPLELRRINALGVGKETITGQILKSGVGYKETIEAVASRSEAALQEIQRNKEMQADPCGCSTHSTSNAREDNPFKESTIKEQGVSRNLPEEVDGTNNQSTKKIGIGFASSYKNVGLGTGKPDYADAIIELTEAGRILLKIGATDIGQGSDTVMAQIAATVIGIDYDLFDVISCDTALCPDGGMTTASRQTYVTGNAVKLAAEEWKQKLNQLANRCSQRTDACLQFKSMDVEKQQNTLKTIFQCAKSKETVLEAYARYHPPTTYPLRESADHLPGVAPEEFDIHYAYCFGTHAAIVEVDTDTGEVEVLKIIAAQDVGNAIHPQNIKGQIEGSVAMGVGYALSEEYVVEDNKIITDNLFKLKIPKITQVPDIESIIVEVEQPEGPLGAKGMGEIPINPVAPAIANAIYQAVGVRVHSLPIKPETIKSQLENKG